MLEGQLSSIGNYSEHSEVLVDFQGVGRAPETLIEDYSSHHVQLAPRP